MTELQELMRRNVADPPHDVLDVAAVMSTGRRRVRRRRLRVAGVAAVAVAVVAVGSGGVPRTARLVGLADSPPAPAAPTLHLSDATSAAGLVDVLASQTNDDLDSDNGRYFDGVTDDGQILFRDGPHIQGQTTRLALMDPATGVKDWLPDPHLGMDQTFPALLGSHRLVLTRSAGYGPKVRLVAEVFDRDSRRWHTISWPSLPEVRMPQGVMGPDGRLYVEVPSALGRSATPARPADSSGVADDAGAPGVSYRLFSVSLEDPSDVRNEYTWVGDVAFTSTSMVWTDRTNGAPGMVHVRDLSSGHEVVFDPQVGARCNVLSLSATASRVVLGEYCGTYSFGDRDDRVQVLTTTGDQVVTIQDSGLTGYVASLDGTSDQVSITSGEGTYVYDLGTDRFLRVSDAVSRFGLGGPAPDGELLWSTPLNDSHGATQWLGRLHD